MVLKIRIDKRNNFIYVKREEDGMVMGKVFPLTPNDPNKIEFDLTMDLFQEFDDFLIAGLDFHPGIEPPSRKRSDISTLYRVEEEDEKAILRKMVDSTPKWLHEDEEQPKEEKINTDSNSKLVNEQETEEDLNRIYVDEFKREILQDSLNGGSPPQTSYSRKNHFGDW